MSTSPVIAAPVLLTVRRVVPERVAVMSPLAATDTLDVPLVIAVLSIELVEAEVILPLASTVIAGIADELP